LVTARWRAPAAAGGVTERGVTIVCGA